MMSLLLILVIGIPAVCFGFAGGIWLFGVIAHCVSTVWNWLVLVIPHFKAIFWISFNLLIWVVAPLLAVGII